MANIICINCMKGTLNASGVCTVCGKTDEEIKTSRRHLPLRTILRGKYLMGKVIGEGGFGITYLGYDLDLEIRVAIKEFCPRDFAGRDSQDGLTILPFDEESEEFYEKEKEKFINEAKRLAKFRREQGIVSVQDYFHENGTAYIVMEYIDGITLKAFHKMMNKNMEPEKLLDLMRPIMEGLSKLHANGIIHRDISPDNIMIDTSKQQVYLIDFGTAREVNPDEEHSLSVYKKGGYTPIEQQSRHGKQGPWTDVYALCATIYRCITGTSIPEANNRVMGDEIVRPSSMGIAISSQAEEAILNGLALKPQDRTQSITELMGELYADVAQPLTGGKQESVSDKESESKAEEPPALSKQEQTGDILDSMTENDRFRYENEIQKWWNTRKTMYSILKASLILFVSLYYCLIIIFILMVIIESGGLIELAPFVGNAAENVDYLIFAGAPVLLLLLIATVYLYAKKHPLFYTYNTSDTIRMQVYYLCNYVIKDELDSWYSYYANYIGKSGEAKNLSQYEKTAWSKALTKAEKRLKKGEKEKGKKFVSLLIALIFLGVMCYIPNQYRTKNGYIGHYEYKTISDYEITFRDDNGNLIETRTYVDDQPVSGMYYYDNGSRGKYVYASEDDYEIYFYNSSDQLYAYQKFKNGQEVETVRY